MLRSYVEALQQTYMIRILQPWSGNLKKRLVKSPKIYIRDSGILHALLQIPDFDTLYAHPVAGASWETMVIENIIQHFPDFEYSFYRTSHGSEIDLVIQKGIKTYALEIKLSSAPKLSAGFYNAMDDLNIEKACVVAPVESAFPLKENVMVGSLEFVIGEMEKL
jgi:predicted AAA+ superfamily ATPase